MQDVFPLESLPVFCAEVYMSKPLYLRHFWRVTECTHCIVLLLLCTVLCSWSRYVSQLRRVFNVELIRKSYGSIFFLLMFFNWCCRNPSTKSARAGSLQVWVSLPGTASPSAPRWPAASGPRARAENRPLYRWAASFLLLRNNSALYYLVFGHALWVLAISKP